MIEVGGWRLLTDPTFDAVLLSHGHHDDNLDSAGRELLPAAGAVVTTVAGAGRLGEGARGLEPWATTRLEAPGRSSIAITATPSATARRSAARWRRDPGGSAPRPEDVRGQFRWLPIGEAADVAV